MKKIISFLILGSLLSCPLLADTPQQIQQSARPQINKKIVKMSPSQLKVEHYLKLDKNGDNVVQDNISKLMWEVKSNMDNHIDYDNPNDADNVYTWYNPDQNVNGGHQGLERNGTDSLDFINALNSRQYAGYSDWRMPTIDELKTLVIEAEKYPYINQDLFPNTVYLVNHKPHYYWSATTYNYSDPPGTCAWNIAFNTGHAAGNHVKWNKYHIRAVRDIP